MFNDSSDIKGFCGFDKHEMNWFNKHWDQTLTIEQAENKHQKVEVQFNWKARFRNLQPLSLWIYSLKVC